MIRARKSDESGRNLHPGGKGDRLRWMRGFIVDREQWTEMVGWSGKGQKIESLTTADCCNQPLVLVKYKYTCGHNYDDRWEGERCCWKNI